MNFNHLLWTRLNKDLYNRHLKKEDQDKWMEYRLSIWKDYCLKSIKNLDLIGAEDSFYYLVVCDILTSPNDRFNIIKILLESEIKNYDIIFVHAEKTTTELKHYVRKKYCDKDILIATRFDSDDLLRHDFCQKLYECVEKYKDRPLPYSINFPCGYCYDIRTKEKSLNTLLSSMTGSIINSSKAEELYLSAHGFAHTMMPVYQEHEKEEMWVRTIHDKNNSSRMSGEPVKEIIGDFGVKL